MYSALIAALTAFNLQPYCFYHICRYFFIKSFYPSLLLLNVAGWHHWWNVAGDLQHGDV